ncbi:PucR family transcriptional regulator [Millisia brevis]|uniref:PucR family transcriptional regulator n=1 Tax=Millisia brevis TaxID=264148 RepID=UPI00082B458A|nr:PucR family transcriptional regulator [Millisia brevis]
MQTDNFRLVDLLLDPTLGLELVSDCSPHMPLAGAHSIEIAHPSDWLQPGTVMLTTGSLFSDAEIAKNPAQALRGLVRELVSAGVAALGYGVGIVTEEVPRPLIDEANRHHFAVFSVPREVPFMAVIDRVVEQTHSGESHVLWRTLAMQERLLDALGAADPEQELTARLATILRCSVLLYNDLGNVVASSGRAPSHLMKSQLKGRSGHLRFRVGKWSVTADSIHPGGEPHWLVVASTRHEVPDALARATLEISVRMLNAIERSRYRAAVENRARQAAFVRELVTGEIVDQFGAEGHLESLRFGHRPRLRVFVLSSAADYDNGRWATRAATVLDAVEDDAVDLARLLRLPVMFAQLDGRLVGVVPADMPALSGWIANLSDGVTCGFSEPFRDLRTGAERLRKAQRALRVAQTRGMRHTEFENVDIADWLLTGHDRTTTAAKAAEQLAVLGEDSGYVEFLRVFFANDLDVGATAESLAVHPNTVRHRIKRIESMFGESLRSPALITAIHLSLEVLELEDGRRRQSTPQR